MINRQGSMPPSKDTEVRLPTEFLLQSGISEKCRTYHGLDYRICVTLILTQHKNPQ